jgi:SAM-dependent methyltransferase
LYHFCHLFTQVLRDLKFSKLEKKEIKIKEFKLKENKNKNKNKNKNNFIFLISLFFVLMSTHSCSRPESTGPPQLFYNEDEAEKYHGSSRMAEIQSKLSLRALELLNLPQDDIPRLILDIGCGTALSGEVIESEGHYWIGVDISRHMLNVASQRELVGDLIQNDMGEGLPLRAGTFDGAISISALQWLCNADAKDHVPQKRLRVFFDSLYASLASGTRGEKQKEQKNIIFLFPLPTCLISAFSFQLLISTSHFNSHSHSCLSILSGRSITDRNDHSGSHESRIYHTFSCRLSQFNKSKEILFMFILWSSTNYDCSSTFRN